MGPARSFFGAARDELQRLSGLAAPMPGYPDLGELEQHFDLVLGRPPQLTDLGDEDGVVVAMQRADGLEIPELHQQVATLARVTREAELPPKLGLLVLVYERGCPAELLETLRTPGRFRLLAHLWARVILVDLDSGQVVSLAGPRGDGTVASGTQITRMAAALKELAHQQISGKLAGGTATLTERQREALFARRMMGAPVVTMALLLANLGAWLLMEASGGSTVPMVLERFGAQANALVRDGEVWRLVSACFLHIGHLHLAFNALVLFFFGRACENIYGRGAFLLLYLVSGVAGGVATVVLLDPSLTSAGASGAIFGLLGAQLVFGLRHRTEIPGRHKITFILGAAGWILLFILSGLRLQSVNNAAHVGGLIGGALCALALRPRIIEATIPAAGRRRDLVLGLLAAVALLAALVPTTYYALTSGARPLPVGQHGYLFYRAPATRQEAARLVGYLAKLGFSGGALELRREEQTHVLRLAVPRGAALDQDFQLTLQQLLHNVTQKVFPDAPVRLDLCDGGFVVFRRVELLEELGPGFGEPIEKARDKEAVLAGYKAAARRFPRASSALNNLAWGYAQLGRKLDRALTLARKAVELKPTAEALDTLAYVHLRRGELDAAEREIQRAIKKDPQRKVFKQRLDAIRRARGE